MPNHVHGIIHIIDFGNVGAKNFSPLQHCHNQQHTGNAFHSPSKTMGSIVRGFKIGVTKWIHKNTIFIMYGNVIIMNTSFEMNGIKGG
jgi:hypothetical protein